MASERGLGATRAAGHRSGDAAAGRFTVDDPKLALAVAGGRLLGLGKLLQKSPNATTPRPPTE